MIGTLSRAAALWISMVAAISPLLRPLIRKPRPMPSEARSEPNAARTIEAHCASIPPGGMASLQCLQKNMSSLSSGCQSAVRAVGTPSEAKTAPPAAPAKTESETAVAPKAESAAAPRPAGRRGRGQAPPKAATATTSKPSNANIAAIRSACRSDYSRVCAGVPTGGAPALQCLEKNKSRVSAACQKAVAAVSDNAAPPTAGGAALQLPRRRPARRARPLQRYWCFGRCDRAKNCSCCGRHAAPTSARFARRRPRRRSAYAVPGGAVRLALAGLPWRIVRIRRTISRRARQILV